MALIVEVLPTATHNFATTRQYRFTFGGSQKTRHAQHSLLESFNWSFKLLLQTADEHHALQLRYDQIRNPSATLAHYVSFPLNSIRRSRPLRVFLHLHDAPTAFTPFVSLPDLEDTLQPHRRGNRVYSRQQVLRELAAGRLGALPNHLTDTHYVLDGLTPTQLAYPLERLGLLSVLTDDTSWQIHVLPGGIIQLSGPLMGDRFLFLQPVRAARLREAGRKTGKNTMRIAA